MSLGLHSHPLAKVSRSEAAASPSAPAPRAARRVGALACGALALLVSSGATHAQAPTTFFAEDFNWGDPGGGQVVNYPTNPYDATGLDAPGPLALASRVNVNAARAAFIALFTSVDVESFETYSNGQSIGQTIPDNTPLQTVFFPLAGVTGTFTNSGRADVQRIPGTLPNEPGPDGTHNGTYATEGSNYVLSVAGTGARQFKMSLSQPVNSYAATFTDFDGDGTLTVTLTRADLTTVRHTVSPAADQTSDARDNLTGSVLFWGVIDPVPFIGVEFNYSGLAADGIGIDELTIGLTSQLAVECAIEPTECVAPGGQLLWGAMQLADQSLAAFRCTVAGTGATPICDTDATGALIAYPPVCE